MASHFSPLYSIGEQSYYIQPGHQATLPKHQLRKLQLFDTDLISVTVINWDSRNFSRHDLDTVCNQYQKEDDVWSRSFLSSECDQVLPAVVLHFHPGHSEHC